MNLSRIFAVLAALLSIVGVSSAHAAATSPLANEVILIIRHAEKMPDGPGFTPAGQNRANLYADYFKNFRINGVIRPPDSLFAAADSKKTQRCRLTITPLSNALHSPINATIKNKDVDALAALIQQHPGGKTVLIAWHHEQIANLLLALGANPPSLIPDDTWPEDRYNWLIELRYDGGGHLEPAQDKLIVEHVLPTDAR
jgi:hypothetical protein